MTKISVRTALDGGSGDALSVASWADVSGTAEYFKPMVAEDPTGVVGTTSSRVVSMPPAWRIVLLVAALICGVIVVRNVFGEAHRIIGWAVAASLIALLLSPVVQLMDRRMPRALAIVLTFLMVIAIGVGITWLYSSSVLDQVAEIQESGPSVAEQIEERDDRIGQLARDIDLTDQVSELTDRLDERTGSGDDVIRSAAMSAPPYFVSMILTIFLLLFGPEMVRAGLDQLRPARRDRLRRAVSEASRRTQIYVWATIAQALVSAALIWMVGTWLGVPAAGLLALFGAVAAFVPYLGIVVGWIPLLLMGTGAASGVQFGVAVLVAVALQLVEALWWRRVVDRRSLHVGPAVPVIVAMLGLGVYGIGGALYGCVLAVLALALADQLAPGDDALPTPVDDLSATTSASASVDP